MEAQPGHQRRRCSPRRAGGSVEKSAKTLADGFVHAGHFEVVEDGTAVRFRSHLNGATTGGSKLSAYRAARDEARRPEGEGGAGRPTNRTSARLTARVKVTQAPTTPEPQPGVDRADPRRRRRPRSRSCTTGRRRSSATRGPTATATGSGSRTADRELHARRRWFTYRIEVEGRHGPHSHRRRPGVQAEGREDRRCRERCYFKAGAYTQSQRRSSSPAPRPTTSARRCSAASRWRSTASDSGAERKRRSLRSVVANAASARSVATAQPVLRSPAAMPFTVCSSARLRSPSASATLRRCARSSTCRWCSGSR